LHPGFDNTNKNTNNTQKSNSIEVILGAGYHYTFVIEKNFYFGLGITPGYGLMNTKLTTRYPDEDFITKQNNPIFRWEGRGGMGYNSEKIYTGIYVDVVGSSYTQENTTAMNHDTRWLYELFFGYRITAPKAINNILRKFKL
jgi:hypothetical protein